MTACIDIHAHVVPERFPEYAGHGADVPWPSMADAHATAQFWVGSPG